MSAINSSLALTTAEKSCRYREKMKGDPAKYAEYLKKARQRQRFGKTQGKVVKTKGTQCVTPVTAKTASQRTVLATSTSESFHPMRASRPLNYEKNRNRKHNYEPSQQNTDPVAADSDEDIEPGDYCGGRRFFCQICEFQTPHLPYMAAHMHTSHQMVTEAEPKPGDVQTCSDESPDIGDDDPLSPVDPLSLGSEEDSLPLKLTVAALLQVTPPPSDLTSTSRPTTSNTMAAMEKIKILEQENKRLEEQTKTLAKIVTIGEKGNINYFEGLLKADEKRCKYYTGFSYNQVETILKFLETSSVENWMATKKYSMLTSVQQFLILMLRLRRGVEVRDIAYQFGVATGLVSDVIMVWIELVYRKFAALRSNMFSSRNVIRKNLPDKFKKLTNLRVIIDCAEFHFERSVRHKSGNEIQPTLKVLLGCSPNGVVSFVSKHFEGPISDRDLLIQSGLLELLEDGDLVLADRGFHVKSTTGSKRAEVEIPSFVKGRNALTPEEEIEKKKIVKYGIFAEDIVRRLKEYKILSQEVPVSLRSEFSQIVFICACLLNLNTPLVQ